MSVEFLRLTDVPRLAQVLAERERQRERYTSKHDRDHDGAQWVALLARHVGKLADAEMGGGPRIYEQRLVELAALVLAALEAEQARS